MMILTKQQAKKNQGFAIIDVVIALVLIAAITGTAIYYVYSQSSEQLGDVSCQEESELFATAKACGLTIKANTGDFPACTAVAGCVADSYQQLVVVSTATGADFSIGDNGADGVEDFELSCIDSVPGTPINIHLSCTDDSVDNVIDPNVCPCVGKTDWDTAYSTVLTGFGTWATNNLCHNTINHRAISGNDGGDNWGVNSVHDGEGNGALCYSFNIDDVGLVVHFSNDPVVATQQYNACVNLLNSSLFGAPTAIIGVTEPGDPIAPDCLLP